MGAPQDLFLVLDLHVRVDLRAQQARVPEDRLDVAEVRLVTQHVSCHGMAEGVRAEPSSNSASHCRPLHDIPHRTRGKMSAVSVLDEERLLGGGVSRVMIFPTLGPRRFPTPPARSKFILGGLSTRPAGESSKTSPKGLVGNPPREVIRREFFSGRRWFGKRWGDLFVVRGVYPRHHLVGENASTAILRGRFRHLDTLNGWSPLGNGFRPP
jgi:hypothetical protein